MTEELEQRLEKQLTKWRRAVKNFEGDALLAGSELIQLLEDAQAAISRLSSRPVFGPFTDPPNIEHVVAFEQHPSMTTTRVAIGDRTSHELNVWESYVVGMLSSISDKLTRVAGK